MCTPFFYRLSFVWLLLFLVLFKALNLSKLPICCAFFVFERKNANPARAFEESVTPIHMEMVERVLVAS